MGATSSSSSAKTSSTTTTTTTTTTQNDTSITGKTFSGLGNCVKLLPTGTVFLFQFLNPVVTNSGHCEPLNKYLSGALLVVCAFNCAFASFTDSYTGGDGKRHYGIVTTKGLWPSPASERVDMSKYKLRIGDFVHAFLGLIVFAVLGLLDTNTVHCFYPKFESTEKFLMQVLPTAIGAASTSVFMLFPSTRHGIGYPRSSDDSDSTNTSSQNEKSEV